jgi:hypothetical protein
MLKEMTTQQTAQVAAAGAGHVGACVAAGGLGLKGGSALGPWGAAGGAAVGCAVGVLLYML